MQLMRRLLDACTLLICQQSFCPRPLCLLLADFHLLGGRLEYQRARRQAGVRTGVCLHAGSVLVSSALAFVAQLVPVAAGVQGIMHMALDVLLCIRLPRRCLHLRADARPESHVTRRLPFERPDQGLTAPTISYLAVSSMQSCHQNPRPSDGTSGRVKCNTGRCVT